MLRWIKRLIEGPPFDQEALLRELAERARPDVPTMPMHEHLAKLPPPPPMFEPEWLGDTTWRDPRLEE